MGAPPEKEAFGRPGPAPRDPGWLWETEDAGAQPPTPCFQPPFLSRTHLRGLRRPHSSPRRWKILPSTLSKSSKFSDRMIFQLPEKLGMVAALVAVPLDPSAGALDAESFSRKRCAAFARS